MCGLTARALEGLRAGTLLLGITTRAERERECVVSVSKGNTHTRKREGKKNNISMSSSSSSLLLLGPRLGRLQQKLKQTEPTAAYNELSVFRLLAILCSAPLSDQIYSSAFRARPTNNKPADISE